MSDNWIPCPHCGGDIKADAAFCRHCGSSEDDGWKEEADYDDVDDFDYDEFVQNELGGDGVSGAYTNLKTKGHWRLVAVVLLLLFFFGFLLI